MLKTFGKFILHGRPLDKSNGNTGNGNTERKDGEKPLDKSKGNMGNGNKERKDGEKPLDKSKGNKSNGNAACGNVKRLPRWTAFKEVFKK